MLIYIKIHTYIYIYVYTHTLILYNIPPSKNSIQVAKAPILPHSSGFSSGTLRVLRRRRVWRLGSDSKP